MSRTRRLVYIRASILAEIARASGKTGPEMSDPLAACSLQCLAMLHALVFRNRIGNVLLPWAQKALRFSDPMVESLI